MTSIANRLFLKNLVFKKYIQIFIQTLFSNIHSSLITIRLSWKIFCQSDWSGLDCSLLPMGQICLTGFTKVKFAAQDSPGSNLPHRAPKLSADVYRLKMTFRDLWGMWLSATTVTLRAHIQGPLGPFRKAIFDPNKVLNLINTIFKST